MNNIHRESTVPLHTGRTMPIIGLGTWELTEETAETIAEALDMGYPMIDTSGDYETQPGIGDGIWKSGVPRESFYLVTKVEEDDDAYQATEQNLAELQLDYADLVLIHRPPKDGVGENLWRGLIQAKTDGLTKDIGVSNYSATQIQNLADATGEVPVVNQIEWSPFGWSKLMLEFCRANNIVIQAYSPLTRATRLDDGILRDLSDKHEREPSQILIRWCLQKGVIPLPKANQLRHLAANLDVFDFELSGHDMADLETLNESYSALGDQPVYMEQ